LRLAFENNARVAAANAFIPAIRLTERFQAGESALERVPNWCIREARVERHFSAASTPVFLLVGLNLGRQARRGPEGPLYRTHLLGNRANSIPCAGAMR